MNHFTALSIDTDHNLLAKLLMCNILFIFLSAPICPLPELLYPSCYFCLLFAKFPL